MTASTGTRPESTIDLSDLAVNHDPFPHYEEIRALGPAVWNPPSKSWLIPSYDHAKSVFSNFRDFAQNEAMFGDMYGVVTLPGLDNPRHNEVRSVLGPFMARTAAESYATVAQDVMEHHLLPLFERMRAGETVDVAGVYRTVSTDFIARLLGVPREDCPRFVTWAEQMAGVFDLAISPGREDAEAVRAAAAKGTAALNEYATEALRRRAASGDGSDMLGALATTEVPLTEAERIGYVTMVIQGGQDTTATWAKNLTVALATHPEQRRAVAEDRGLLRQTLDEVIRWQAPVTAEVRVVRNAGVEIGGVPLEQGDNLLMMLAAAHRDPARFERPEEFDIHRAPMGNLGFGFGVHNCMGLNIARRLVTTFANILLDEIPEYELAIPLDDLDYGRSYAIRGASNLPLAL